VEPIPEPRGVLSLPQALARVLLNNPALAVFSWEVPRRLLASSILCGRSGRGGGGSDILVWAPTMRLPWSCVSGRTAMWR